MKPAWSARWCQWRVVYDSAHSSGWEACARPAPPPPRGQGGGAGDTDKEEASQRLAPTGHPQGILGARDKAMGGQRGGHVTPDAQSFRPAATPRVGGGGLRSQSLTHNPLA